MELCKRLKYGDLRERYENEVIYDNHEERVSFLTVVNIICGNVEVECAYAAAGIATGKSFTSFSAEMSPFQICSNPLLADNLDFLCILLSE